MKKRIISLLAIVAMLSSLMVVPVNAAKVHTESYDAFTAADDPTVVASWKLYDNNSAYSGGVFEDGTLKFHRKPAIESSTGPIYSLQIVTNGEHPVIIFDFKQAIKDGVGGYIYPGNGLRFSNTLSNPTANEWYTHMYRARYDATLNKEVVDSYIKGPFATPEQKAAAEWTFRSTLTTQSDSKGTPAGLQINMNAASYEGQTIWFNNIEVHQGLYMSELKFQTSYNDGGAPVETEVTTVGEIVDAAAAGTGPVALETKIDFYDCNFAVGNTSNAFGQTLDVYPVLLALDENGMLLDCNIVPKSINPIGINNKVTVDFSNITSYVNQIDKVQLLIWDSIEGMQPIFDTIELN